MAIRVALRHRTEYSYDRAVTLSPQVVRLRPAAHSRTHIDAYSFDVQPKNHFLHWQQDAFGNFLARLVFPDAVTEFTVDVTIVAELVTVNPFDFFLDANAEHWPVEYDAALTRELTPYLQSVDAGSKFEQLVTYAKTQLGVYERRTVDVLVDINQHIQRILRYDIRMEPGVFSPEETLVRGHGSCRDFAWLLVNLLRRLGIAARFVSGYSIQLVADQKPLEGPAGVSQDCTDLHAWAEAYLPGAGWIGLDATSGLFCGEGHIPLACTAEPASAAPISGSFDFDHRHPEDEVNCDFKVEMQVTRLEDRPRPTKSYTEEQWQAIVTCGDRVDHILRTEDVRLTLGGEPTFVSVDDMEAEEWNTAALGPTKAGLADALIRRLHQSFAPFGLVAHGQGKWYPGEPLPRWAYSLYFRTDGEPVWNDIRLISDGTDQGHGAPLAEQFMQVLAKRLGVAAECAMPAFEDTFYYLWRERRLPSNVDPFESRLEDELERDRVRRIFEQGMTSVIGYALPLRAPTFLDGTYRWETGRWFLRSERLYLLPGDSPMGFRLPLDSLPWAAEVDRDIIRPTDSFGEFPHLHRHAEYSVPRTVLQSRTSTGAPTRGQFNDADSADGYGEPMRGHSGRAPARGQSATVIVRTALCIEPRGGVLHVFLPPLETLDAYLELVAKLELTARELKAAIRIEGYPPPNHPNLQRISVTPDPGVIEVNIHPAHSWREVLHNTTTLYELARLTRLGTDKFMLDGRHTGTGGGNHIVLGGATTADSPFLRRPELLTSLVAFFNNHPSLSYVFSGLFVGPTSQAPRLDEARNDSLYELEIARRTLQAAGTDCPMWTVDRVLRHLLVDVTGNTHRAEFCIDKLYSPDSPQGRLGLLEMRAFEMPPDARMSCAQQLLIRAMVAHFWQRPYRRPLVRWGTVLHDRFALPVFLWEDLKDALSELSPSGMEISPEWFLPHWEFRFPRLGKTSYSGVELELRQALEPWHVLGEEPTAGGTARYVDSSVERIQVLVDGMTDSRHIVSIFGRPLPLVSTGRAGQFAAAVRYKAWKPPSSLHPTLAVNAPLVIDLYDSWSERAIGGCAYHVSHPGGMAFDRFPTNGLVAESRRMARFLPFGYRPGAYELAVTERSLEYPITLDLRLSQAR
ncbi:MAG TPA: transglutaminase family protein [Polyangiaceae bacterium]